MAKDKIADYDASAAGNTDIGGIGIQGTNFPSNFDNALRELMSQLKDADAGTSPLTDTWSFCDPADRTKIFRIDAGSITTATTRTYTAPNASGTLPLLSLAQTWSATQTFSTNPAISNSAPALTLTDTDTNAVAQLIAASSVGAVALNSDSTSVGSAPETNLQVRGVNILSCNSTTATFSADVTLGTNKAISFAGTGAATTRTNLGLGTAATQNTGTSGANVPLLNGTNTWANTQTFSATVDANAVKSATTVLSSGLSSPTDFAVSATAGHFLGDNASASGFSRGGGPAVAVQRNTSNGTALLWFRATTQVGDVTVSTTTTTYNTSSDYRRKPIRQPLSGFWGRISRVIPRRFQWDTGEWDAGFIAHEFAEVYPNAVSGEKDAVDEAGKPIYQTMQASTSEVIADVMAALQELNGRVTALEEAANG